jgi:aspartate racemase
MRESFFREGLLRHGIQTFVPAPEDRERINHIIYEELCRGDIRPQSRQVFLDIIGRLQQAGAQGVILGCTEIPLPVRPGDCALPLFNTSLLHAETALHLATQDTGAP